MSKVQSKLKGPALIQAQKKQRRSFIKFALLFIVTAILFYLISSAKWFDYIRIPLTQMFAWVSSHILNLFGFNTTTVGQIIQSSTAAIEVKEGCDAIAPAVLYIASVMAFPLSLSARLNGLWQGLLAIFVLNVIRICSLFIVYSEARQYFDFLHVEIWQSLFVIATLVFFILWVRKYKNEKV